MEAGTKMLLGRHVSYHYWSIWRRDGARSDTGGELFISQLVQQVHESSLGAQDSISEFGRQTIIYQRSRLLSALPADQNISIIVIVVNKALGEPFVWSSQK